MKILKSLKPTSEFLKRTKAVFLTAYRVDFPNAALRPYYAWRYFVRGAAVGIAGMLIVTSLSAYADHADVNPDSALYSLKRSSEVVRTEFTPTPDLPVLHSELATRRLNELEFLKGQAAPLSKVENISKDLEQEIEKSFASAPTSQTINKKESGVNKESSRQVKTPNNNSEIKLPRATSTPATTSASFAAPEVKTLKINPVPPINKDRARVDSKKVSTTTEREDSKAGSLQKNKIIVPTINSERFSKTCEVWKKLEQNGSSEIQGIFERHPEFRARFQEKCFDSIDPKD